jgi:hypothetical protein
MTLYDRSKSQLSSYDDNLGPSGCLDMPVSPLGRGFVFAPRQGIPLPGSSMHEGVSDSSDRLLAGIRFGHQDPRLKGALGGSYLPGHSL